MSNERSWEDKYRIRSLVDIPQPAAFLQKHAASIGSSGSALDIAMGSGQNAVFLAQRGFAVTGVDRSKAAVELARQYAADRGVTINAQVADMLEWKFPENQFDVIINFYFLERELLPRIKAGLKKGGILVFETYTLEQQSFNGPHNPDFLLKPNELLEAFLDLFVFYYHERTETDGAGGRKAVASMMAKKL